jgi:streptogramin lyase
MLDAFAAVRVTTPGTYRLRMDGPSDAVLEINGVSVGGPGQEITTVLAGGTQRIRVTAQVEAPATVNVRWAPPGAATLEPIPFDHLYREQRAALGLLAFYRSGTNPDAAPELSQVERYVQRDALPPALARPYVVDWVGIIDAPKTGTYRFRIDASGPASLWIDDRPILLDAPPGSDPISTILPEGDHRLQARLIDEQGPTRFDLQWAPPGEDFGAVPTLRLRPPDARVETVALTGRSQEPPLRPLGEARVRWLASTEGEPRAVAVRPDGTVFLANASTRRVQQVIDEGRDVASLPAPFATPSDLEIGPDGSVWVLDAQRAEIVRLAADGTPAQTITNANLGLYRPRGLAIGPDGTIWIADTGGSRVVKLAADGTMLASIGPDVGGPEAIRQPTDVAVGPSGEIFVVNGEGGALIRLTADGAYQRHWSVLPADTERGAHLAIGDDRSLWVSEPDGRRISRFTFDGTPSGIVDLLRDTRLLRVPVGIAVGPDGTLYVADTSLRAVVALAFGP